MIKTFEEFNFSEKIGENLDVAPNFKITFWNGATLTTLKNPFSDLKNS